MRGILLARLLHTLKRVDQYPPRSGCVAEMAKRRSSPVGLCNKLSPLALNPTNSGK
ncbi:hypothetical protein FTUN_5375 [Frigoriglobus tundricola]|uniref:Uncharacterized protein n=1 Tax=Frigoriglobus tundricola TaxID=2774151 RepID=A0A6M5YUQ4_9BACT|nr:hypothetical protein FTUN_5375 [Frigoriglobus tundricola]